MKKFILPILLLLIVIAAFFFVNKQSSLKTPSPQSSSQTIETMTPTATIGEATANPIVDRKARFAIFTHGTFRIFTAAMYHNLSENVYIEGSNPNIVIVKKRGTTWNDFFTTLPFKLSRDCLTTGTGQTFCTNADNTLKFYLNEVADDDALTKEIQEGDMLLVSYGSKNDPQIQKQLESLSAR